MNKTQVTLRGLVATTPRTVTLPDNTLQTSFRLVTVEADGEDYPRLDGSEGKTNWFTVQSREQLAENVYASIQKGNRVILTGDLEVNDWDNGERTGTSVEIIVSAIGHDLMFCTTESKRVFNAGVMS